MGEQEEEGQGFRLQNWTYIWEGREGKKEDWIRGTSDGSETLRMSQPG